MRSVSPIVHAFRRRSAAVLLTLAAVVPASAYAQTPVIDWSKDDAEALIRVIERAADEGLDPDHYGLAALRRGAAPDALTNAALRLASDFRYGRVGTTDRVDWHGSEAPNPLLVAQIVAQAVAEDRIEEAYERLLPQHDEYRALKRALADTPAGDLRRRTALRVNLERWRWMPRELGDKHVFVNIPAYRVELVDGGSVVAEHAAVVGKPSTPTPAFSTAITAVRFNPGWAVPPGLKKQKLSLYKRNPAAARRMGYSVSYTPDGVSIWQKPGPGNALGQVRVVMPNPFMIYLHDTPDKHLFAKAARALSQGCVRTERPVEFAERLLTDDGTDAAVIDAALADRDTEEIGLNRPVPVHIAYFTADADASGAVKLLSDPYGRDGRVAQALGAVTQLASK
jgi:L,D-transpeptidase YcbB